MRSGFGDITVDAGNGEIFDRDRHDVHRKVDNDSNFGGGAIDKGDEQRAKELAQQIKAAHLRIHSSQSRFVVLCYDDDLLGCVNQADICKRGLVVTVPNPSPQIPNSLWSRAFRGRPGMQEVQVCPFSRLVLVTDGP